jgi:hypothetical protein
MTQIAQLAKHDPLLFLTLMGLVAMVIGGAIAGGVKLASGNQKLETGAIPFRLAAGMMVCGGAAILIGLVAIVLRGAPDGR